MFYASIISNHDLALKMSQVLIEMGVNPLKEDSIKQNPLFYATREGNLGVIALLLEKGGDINKQDKYGQTPIYYCVREGKIKVA